MQQNAIQEEKKGMKTIYMNDRDYNPTQMIVSRISGYIPTKHTVHQVAPEEGYYNLTQENKCDDLKEKLYYLADFILMRDDWMYLLDGNILVAYLFLETEFESEEKKKETYFGLN